MHQYPEEPLFPVGIPIMGRDGNYGMIQAEVEKAEQLALAEIPRLLADAPLRDSFYSTKSRRWSVNSHELISDFESALSHISSASLIGDSSDESDTDSDSGSSSESHIPGEDMYNEFSRILNGVRKLDWKWSRTSSPEGFSTRLMMLREGSFTEDALIRLQSAYEAFATGLMKHNTSIARDMSTDAYAQQLVRQHLARANAKPPSAPLELQPPQPDESEPQSIIPSVEFWTNAKQSRWVRVLLGYQTKLSREDLEAFKRIA
ncbi:MAG: uncharacterized protein KVP18_003697 [Porospora cf. gigantea A]|uniref:uncharacterized protein n=1 Tax=Porospora cf. gigantea A TaxID=2853593 RepID=UPI003559826E|nr:MAG: hypothetical protein KVP18_003697 [Porospora cf. gigantea A]